MKILLAAVALISISIGATAIDIQPQCKGSTLVWSANELIVDDQLLIPNCPEITDQLRFEATTFILTNKGAIIGKDGASHDAIVANPDCKNGLASLTGNHGGPGQSIIIIAETAILEGIISPGDGGDGQDVTIYPSIFCDSIRVVGGNGGESGRLEIHARQILGDFFHDKADGGDGGSATADARRIKEYGENGTLLFSPDGGNATADARGAPREKPAEEREQGVNADAFGGHGARGEQNGGVGGHALAYAGHGFEQPNITVNASTHSGQGGQGGSARAFGGNGGFGGLQGGHGGDASAYGGNGANGSTNFLPARWMAHVGPNGGGSGNSAKAFGGAGGHSPESAGHGGNATSHGGKGGDGGPSPHRTWGSIGGGGGYATAQGGAPGSGIQANKLVAPRYGGDAGNATAVAGNGGRGGNICPHADAPGSGGAPSPWENVGSASPGGAGLLSRGNDGKATVLQGKHGPPGNFLECPSSDSTSKEEIPGIPMVILLAGIGLAAIAAPRKTKHNPFTIPKSR